jgi:hypothetical protein
LPIKTPQKYMYVIQPFFTLIFLKEHCRSIDQLEKAASSPSVLIPIRVELDTEHHRIRDCFLWNLNEDLLTPELFALTFCNDLEIPQTPYVDQIAGAIKAQLDEHSVVASFDVGTSEETGAAPGEEMVLDGGEEADCRVILSVRRSFSKSALSPYESPQRIARCPDRHLPPPRPHRMGSLNSPLPIHHSLPICLNPLRGPRPYGRGGPANCPCIARGNIEAQEGCDRVGRPRW